MFRKAHLATLLAVALVALSAAAANATQHGDHGTIVGQIAAGGGPPVPPGYARARLAGEVNVITSSGTLVASHRVVAGHLFRFNLRPGVYSLIAAGQTSTGACTPSRVRVRASRVVRAVAYSGCDIP